MRVIASLLGRTVLSNTCLLGVRTSRESCYFRTINARRYASTFRAAVLTKFGSPLEIQNVKQRSLKDNEVRIAVYCCGINSVDIASIAGDANRPVKLPFVPGFEVCGEITEVSKKAEESAKLRVGERVVGLDLKDIKGGFAEEMVMSAEDVFRIDNSISFADGASLINSYATALIALSRRAEVKEGDFVLITGAAGRLGIAAVDLASNVYRCKVIAATTSEERSTAVRDRGAFATVTLGQQDVTKQVNKVTEGKGVPIVIDCIGGDVFQEIVKCVSDEGKVVVTGFAANKIPHVSGNELMENSISVVGVSLEQYRRKRFDVYREAVAEVIDLCKDRLIHPFNASHFPLDDVNKALQESIDRKSVGKVVLDVR